MLRIDFGSGHNAKEGFKTCDITSSPMLDFHFNGETIEDLKYNSVDEFHVRNVIHHIEELDKTLKVLYDYLKQHGTVNVIECRKEFYKANYFLDNLWYRGIIPREEIYISPIYRDYTSVMVRLGFRLCHKYFENEKEVSTWIKL